MAAAALSNRAGSALSALRQSLNFLRSLSTAAASPASGGAASKKPKRKKKKNLFEVAQFLPNWGIGYHMAKTHWTGVSYQITKINLYKDGRHGKAWGIVHKDGLPAAEAHKKISGVHKRCWRYIPNLASTGSSPSIKSATEDSTSKSEAQAA
ncbi:uncharacterized protein LOC116211136 [Punica granatum]|uniref:Uncharacterized protein LOC116211136 n=2 Tax=Punica granatum TaxID=22663 RepID=A0A6P8E0G1_PUNGR|nr:uncharacterized protein LOC116211136 [Punica granatum]PKI66482.1 hypothetical protein CRG98_013138 [Punica granatum]